MTPQQQWNAAWRMARLAQKACTSADPRWLKRPEWIWDSFHGAPLREKNARIRDLDETEGRCAYLRGYRWSLVNNRRFSPELVRRSKHNSQKLVAEMKAAMEMRAKRLIWRRVELLNLIRRKFS